MKKKAIGQIPFRGGKEYQARAYTQEIKGDSYLFVDITEEEPKMRICLTKNDWGIYYPDSGEWSRAQTGECAYDSKKWDNEVKISQEDEKLIQNWTGKNERWDYAIAGHERRIIQDRHSRKQERRRRELDERCKLTPALPPAIDTWADKELFREKHYLYYRKKGRYATICCSKCERSGREAIKAKETLEGQFEKIIEKPEHGIEGTCPYCGAKGTWFAMGRTKEDHDISGYFFSANKYKNDGLVVRYSRAYKTFSFCEVEEKYYAKERVSITEISRMFIERKEIKIADIFKTAVQGYMNGKFWKFKIQKDFHKWDPWRQCDFWDDCNLSGLRNIVSTPAKVHPDTWKVLEGSFAQYSAAKEYTAQAGNDEIDMMRYVEAYIKYPGLEMIVKMGLPHIAKEVVCGTTYLIDTSAKRPEDVLRIYKSRIPMLQAQRGDPRLLKAMQAEKKLQKHWKDDELQAAERLGLTGYEDVLRYMSMRKLMNILEKYYSQEKGGDKHGIARRYVDYINMRNQLGYDMTNTIYLFPRSLAEAHNKMVLEMNKNKQSIREKEVEEKYSGIRENFPEISRKYAAVTSGYIIRPARSATEIVREGRILHHCVGGDSYLAKHNEGRSYILFVRKKEEPEVPYITVEIQGTRIIQWYGAFDKKPDKKVIDKLLADYTKALSDSNRQRIRIAS